ncbi:hypothetical protein V8E36_001410 [Tilletia maclaganii]
MLQEARPACRRPPQTIRHGRRTSGSGLRRSVRETQQNHHHHQSLATSFAPTHSIRHQSYLLSLPADWRYFGGGAGILRNRAPSGSGHRDQITSSSSLPSPRTQPQRPPSSCNICTRGERAVTHYSLRGQLKRSLPHLAGAYNHSALEQAPFSKRNPHPEPKTLHTTFDSKLKGMAPGFGDILNPAPRPARGGSGSAGRESSGGGGAERYPSVSPNHSNEDLSGAYHDGRQHQPHHHHQQQYQQHHPPPLPPPQSSGVASRRSRHSADMTVDIAQAQSGAQQFHHQQHQHHPAATPSAASSSSRPPHLPLPSPSGGGVSRTSISNLLGDSVESPRSRPILSRTSSPSDENRRAYHPPWPPGAGPASAPPVESGVGGYMAGTGAGTTGFMMSNGGQPVPSPRVAVERKTSRSASSSSHGHPPPLSASSHGPLPPHQHQHHHLHPPAGPGPLMDAGSAARTASAPAGPVPASPSASASEASTTGGGGKSMMGRFFGFFRGKEGAERPMNVSPQPIPAMPPHHQRDSPAHGHGHGHGHAGPPPPPLPPLASSSSRMPYNHSPSGGSMLSLPVTPGMPHSPSEHYPYASHMHPSQQQQQHPYASGPHHPGHAGPGPEAEPYRRHTGDYPEHVQYSPTLSAGNNGYPHPHHHQQQQHHQPHPGHHPQHLEQPHYPHASAHAYVPHPQHQHQHQHQSQSHSHPHPHPHAQPRPSLSPTVYMHSLPPPHQQQGHPSHGAHYAPHPADGPPGPGPGPYQHARPAGPAPLGPAPGHAPGPAAMGSDMSPPPVPASTSRSSLSGGGGAGGAGSALKRSGSWASLAILEGRSQIVESAPPTTAPGAGTSAGRKRSSAAAAAARASREPSSASNTPASSRPTSPTETFAFGGSSHAATAASTAPTTSGSRPGSATAPGPGSSSGAAPPLPFSAALSGGPQGNMIAAELRDPKVNVKRLPPPKFAAPGVGVGKDGDGSSAAAAGTNGSGTNVTAGGGARPASSSSSSSSAAAATTLANAGFPSPRTPSASKEWMSATMASAAVGLATGLDGGAAAVAAAATAQAANREKELREKSMNAAAAAGAEEGAATAGGGAAKRRKSSSASTVAAASAKRSSVGGGEGADEVGAVPSTASSRLKALSRKRQNAAAASAAGSASIEPLSSPPLGDTSMADAGGGADATGSNAAGPTAALASDANPYALNSKSRTASISSSTFSRPAIGPHQAGGNGTGARSSSSTDSVPRSTTLADNTSSAAATAAAMIVDPIPYAPHRKTISTVIHRPIYEDEIEALKRQHRNPLRWKYEEERAGLRPKGGNGASASIDAGAGAGGSGSTSSVSAPKMSTLPGKPPGPTPTIPMESSSASSTSVVVAKRKRESTSGPDVVGGGGLDNGHGAAGERSEREAKRRMGGASGLEKGPDNNEVSEHYNSRQEVGVVARRDSKIFPLKTFNNWAKNVLIQRFSHDNCRVLDLGCGKGGDLNKWSRANAGTVIMIDIAGVSVGQAETRYKQQKHRYGAEFYTFDCFSRPLSDVVPNATLRPKFDNITLQFCMHYGWETEAKARQLLDNVARHLRPGGYFIGTIPDADNLLHRLSQLPGDELEFGNAFYKVTFEQKESRPPFGNRYWFFLEDAVDDVPEFVVNWKGFERMAEEAGLRLVYRRTFAQMYYDAAAAERGSDSSRADQMAREDMVRMRIPLPRHEGDVPMQKEMWEACCLYLGFAFQRREDGD